MSRDFLTVASELSMLPDELVDSIAREATLGGQSAESLIAQRGLMSPVQMDIVQTLRRSNEVIPGYELLSLIGQGGMGVVYRARQKTLDRVVAIKTILVSQMSDRSMAARFEQEARAVARLTHPNIIAAIDFGQHDGRLFFVMELIEGEDLESHIDRQRQPEWGGGINESFAWGLAKQAASGLAHAAEQGIVHRDIKPANLLLVEPPAGFPLPVGMPLVKIADFGLAFLATEADARTRLTAANTAVGSPHYVAPEQLAGEVVTERADIYSLGATLFHLLSGKPPYSGLPLTQILTQKLTADAPSLRSVRADISSEADGLVAAMMARRPTDRIASYAELLNRLDQQLQSTTQKTQPAIPVTGVGQRHAPTMAHSTVTATRNTSTSEMAITSLMPVIRAEPSLLETQPHAIPARSTGFQKRRRLLTAIAGGTTISAIAIGLGIVNWSRVPKTARIEQEAVPQIRLTSAGWSEPLFSGRDVDQWTIRSGSWASVQDDEGAFVLSGENGVIARKLQRKEGDTFRPLKHFSLSLAVRLRDAQAIEIHFGHLRVVGSDGPRLVLRVEKETAWLALRTADRSPSEPRSVPTSVMNKSRNSTHSVRITRDATHWFAFVDDLLIGTLPLTTHPEESEVRFLADIGTAWFSDIEVEELQTP